jgi:hypothetical protein
MQRRHLMAISPGLIFGLCAYPCFENYWHLCVFATEKRVENSFGNLEKRFLLHQRNTFFGKGDRKMLGYKSKRAIFFNGRLFCHPISSSSLVKAYIFKSERNPVIWEHASLHSSMQ